MRLRANDSHKSIGGLDNSDHTVFLIDEPKHTLHLVQSDESLLFRAYPPKPLLLCRCTRQAVFDYDHAESPALPVTVTIGLKTAIASYSSFPDAGSGEGAN